jgi:hypothetical protein
MDGNSVLHVFETMHVACDNAPYGFAVSAGEVAIAIRDVAGMFHEDEGLTIIASTRYLESIKLPYTGPYARITISFSSPHNVPGFTAVLIAKLAAVGIPTGVIAAYYHDHIYVPFDFRKEAVALLKNLKNEPVEASTPATPETTTPQA